MLPHYFPCQVLGIGRQNVVPESRKISSFTFRSIPPSKWNSVIVCKDI
jgi:hypothetical protein